MPITGFCPKCKRGPRKLPCLHPVWKVHICTTCAAKLTVEIGTCSECNRQDVPLPYNHPVDKTKGKVCDACYHRIMWKAKKPKRIKRVRRRKFLKQRLVAEAREEKRRERTKVREKPKANERESSCAVESSVKEETTPQAEILGKEKGRPEDPLNTETEESLPLDESSETTAYEKRVEEEEDERIIQKMIKGGLRKSSHGQISRTFLELFLEHGRVRLEDLRKKDKLDYLSVVDMIRASRTFDTMDEFLERVTEILSNLSSKEIERRIKLTGIPARRSLLT